MTTSTTDPIIDFIRAGVVPRDDSHSEGTLERAEAILAAHPGVAGANIHAAAVLGDDQGVRRFLAADPASATATGGPYGWDALTHLCFSRYLRLDPARSGGFVRAATALLDAGASANTGWTEQDHLPEPEWEPVLYGAAGVAHHPELTRLLLERGADPTDVEVVYHTPESYDNRALQLLVETGKLSNDDLVLMLIRKHDWHDVEGAKWLLEHGADPNQSGRWRWIPMHHALSRDNALVMFELLLDHGADPRRVVDGLSVIARAAREGRSDVLELFERRGIPLELSGVDRLVAACAMGDAAAVRAIVEREPHLVREVRVLGGQLLGKFAGTGNAPGVQQLLDLGVDAGASFEPDDGYWGLAKDTTALHVAAWRARPEIVGLLIERGAAVNASDAVGRTPLIFAIKACVDSYWTERRTPESVAALLGAGASVKGVPYPSGYAEVDALLQRAGAASTAP